MTKLDLYFLSYCAFRQKHGFADGTETYLCIDGMGVREYSAVQLVMSGRAYAQTVVRETEDGADICVVLCTHDHVVKSLRDPDMCIPVLHHYFGDYRDAVISDIACRYLKDACDPDNITMYAIEPVFRRIALQNVVA